MARARVHGPPANFDSVLHRVTIELMQDQTPVRDSFGAILHEE